MIYRAFPGASPEVDLLIALLHSKSHDLVPYVLLRLLVMMTTSRTCSYRGACWRTLLEVWLWTQVEWLLQIGRRRDEHLLLTSGGGGGRYFVPASKSLSWSSCLTAITVIVFLCAESRLSSSKKTIQASSPKETESLLQHVPKPCSSLVQVGSGINGSPRSSSSTLQTVG